MKIEPSKALPSEVVAAGSRGGRHFAKRTAAKAMRRAGKGECNEQAEEVDEP